MRKRRPIPDSFASRRRRPERVHANSATVRDDRAGLVNVRNRLGGTAAHRARVMELPASREHRWEKAWQARFSGSNQRCRGSTS
jgi:hypothetical protein